MKSKIFTYSISLFIIFPMFILLSYLTHSTELGFISNPRFQKYIINTIVLSTSVGMITAILGTLSAIVITFFDFPGKRLFQVLFFLPLALPAYIVAFSYAFSFEFAGPVQTFLRDYLDIHYFPNIKSLGGAIFVMSFSFYPYIYMLVRANFISLSYMINTARVMGKSIPAIILQIVLPISRPAIISGVALVIMEVIADFGTPQFLAVDTFTTGIYRTWFLLNDYPSSAQLTSVILILVFILLYIERIIRHKKTYSGLAHDSNEIHHWQVRSKLGKLLLYLFCIIPPFCGFAIPLMPLLYWSFEVRNVLNMDFLFFIENSIMIASIAAVIIVTLSIFFIYSIRNKTVVESIVRIVNMGYAVPSAVIAMGVIIFLAILSKYINFIAYNYLHWQLNIMLVGTTFALLYAYTVRFLSVSTNTLESGFNKIPKEIDWVAQTLGHGKIATCIAVHIPMLIKTIGVAFLLVFIDVTKELSATLIVRPFNFETVATRTYDLIMDERYREAAPSALIITAIGILSTLLMIKVINKNPPEGKQVCLREINS